MHYTQTHKHESKHANMGACSKKVISALPTRSVKKHIKGKNWDVFEF